MCKSLFINVWECVCVEGEDNWWISSTELMYYTQGRWTSWQTVPSVTHTHRYWLLVRPLALIVCVLMSHSSPLDLSSFSCVLLSFTTLWFSFIPLLYPWLALVPNPHLIFFCLSPPISAILILCVRCIVTPVCEMHFKDAACWKSLLVSLPNQSFFHEAKNKPCSDASTLLHAHIWVRFCSRKAELDWNRILLYGHIFSNLDISYSTFLNYLFTWTRAGFVSSLDMSLLKASVFIGSLLCVCVRYVTVTLWVTGTDCSCSSKNVKTHSDTSFVSNLEMHFASPTSSR